MLIKNFLKKEGWTVEGTGIPGTTVQLDFAHKTNTGQSKGVHKHELNEHEIMLVLKGSGKILDNGITRDIEAGDLLVMMNAGEHGMLEKSPDFEIVLMMLTVK